MTNNQNSPFQGGFTPITTFPPNRILYTNANGYAAASDITVEQIEGVVGFPPTIIINSIISSALFTNAYLNGAYPLGTYAIGTTLKFTNISDMPSNTALISRIGNTTWDANLTSFKLS